MSICYASMDSVTMSASGNATIAAITGPFISNDSGGSGIVINNYFETVLYTTVTLNDFSCDSTASANITVYNNSDITYVFDSVIFMDSDLAYSNEEITYELDSRMYKGYNLLPHASVTFTITFKYTADCALNEPPFNNILSSYLNFNFVEIGSYIVTYPGDESTVGLPNSVKPGETLTVNFGTDEHKINKIIMNGIEIDTNRYSFVNNILTIENVTGDISVYVVDISRVDHAVDENSPVVENPITDAPRLTQFYSKGRIESINSSLNEIYRITVNLNYQSTTGKAQSINCILNVNGSDISTKVISFDKNKTTQIADFDNLSIKTGDIIVISFSANNVNNAKVAVSYEKAEYFFRKT